MCHHRPLHGLEHLRLALVFLVLLRGGVGRLSEYHHGNAQGAAVPAYADDIYVFGSLLETRPRTAIMNKSKLRGHLEANGLSLPLCTCNWITIIKDENPATLDIDGQEELRVCEMTVLGIRLSLRNGGHTAVQHRIRRAWGVCFMF